MHTSNTHFVVFELYDVIYWLSNVFRIHRQSSSSACYWKIPSPTYLPVGLVSSSGLTQACLRLLSEPKAEAVMAQPKSPNSHYTGRSRSPQPTDGGHPRPAQPTDTAYAAHRVAVAHVVSTQRTELVEPSELDRALAKPEAPSWTEHRSCAPYFLGPIEPSSARRSMFALWASSARPFDSRVRLEDVRN